MPLRENEQRRPHAHRPSALDEPLSVLYDDQVLTFYDWCRLNRFSERTGRRILHGSNGPVVTMLTSRRLGITVRNNRNWQTSREKA
jgi:hypothetical protein